MTADKKGPSARDFHARVNDNGSVTLTWNQRVPTPVQRALDDWSDNQRAEFWRLVEINMARDMIALMQETAPTGPAASAQTERDEE